MFKIIGSYKAEDKTERVDVALVDTENKTLDCFKLSDLSDYENLIKILDRAKYVGSMPRNHR